MDEREAMRRWVDTWKAAGPELKAILQEQLGPLAEMKETPRSSKPWQLSVR